MDRSLKWRTTFLVAGVLFCIGVLLPSFGSVVKDFFPTWAQSFLGKPINLGLDLQGGKHIVYNIALDKAIDDKASEIQRDLDAQLQDEKIDALVKTPSRPVGAFSIAVKDKAKASAVDHDVDTLFGKDVTKRDCNELDDPGALCYVVSESFGDGLKKAALTNAVATIRDRINEKGVAEPTVVEKGDDIIVELPGDPKSEA